MEREEKKISLNYLFPNKVYEIFLNPSAFTKEEEIIKNQRILSQIYDSICNLYESKKQLENYFPTDKEIYEDLEFRKKAIGDKIPLPTQENVLKLFFVLATQKPAFLLILRELNYNEAERFFFITKIAIPYKNNINFIQNGIQQVIHNSLVTFRNHYTKISTTNLLKQKIQNFNQLEELESILEFGQIYSLFKNIYFYKRNFSELTPNDLIRLNLVNQRIQEIILKPIIYQLVQEKIIVATKRNQYDPSLPDVLLINDIYSIELRFTMLLDLLFHNIIKDSITNLLTSQDKIILNKLPREEQINELCNLVIKKKEKLNKAIFLLATEILSLKEYIQIAKKKEQAEQDKIEIKELIKKISHQQNFFRAKSKGKTYVPERILNHILQQKIPNILFATYPIFNKNYPLEKYYDEIYLLLNDKTNIVNTFKQIEDLFFKIQDIYLIRIWEQMFDYHNKSEEEKNKLFPAIIRESIKELISKSYWNELPLFRRIIIKITKEILDPKTLRNLWNKYIEKHKLIPREPAIPSVQGSKKGEVSNEFETKQAIETQEETIEDKELFEALLKKIQWYLERNTIPTKEVLIHDFLFKKKEMENLFKKIDLGLKSYQDIIQIKVNEKNYFLYKKYIIENKEKLMKKYEEKIKEIQGIQIKGKILSLKVEEENLELYQRIQNLLKTL